MSNVRRAKREKETSLGLATVVHAGHVRKCSLPIFILSLLLRVTYIPRKLSKYAPLTYDRLLINGAFVFRRSCFLASTINGAAECHPAAPVFDAMRRGTSDRTGIALPGISGHVVGFDVVPTLRRRRKRSKNGEPTATERKRERGR